MRRGFKYADPEQLVRRLYRDHKQAEKHIFFTLVIIVDK
jgi:hypothetical protein